ncbi:hypothetical protein [uncultured Megasphaera sp.]|uniref:hypothetical protein n=1 Tax=uncultured Megasphaera sp. TaxID=165188 RepID=UPI0025CD2F72|nr:hypothetical protein [uncultured Megasphaera sp.]
MIPEWVNENYMKRRKMEEIARIRETSELDGEPISLLEVMEMIVTGILCWIVFGLVIIIAT